MIEAVVDGSVSVLPSSPSRRDEGVVSQPPVLNSSGISLTNIMIY